MKCAWKLSEWFSQVEIIRWRFWEFILARFWFAYWCLYGKLYGKLRPSLRPRYLWVPSRYSQTGRLLRLNFEINLSPPLYRPLPSGEEIWGKSNTLALSFRYPYHIQTLVSTNLNLSSSLLLLLNQLPVTYLCFVITITIIWLIFTLFKAFVI